MLATARSTTAPLERLMRPHSVAIVGVSPEPGSIGGLVLGNLERWRFEGAIHLVSRGRREINGRPCVATIDALPSGIDVAILAVPQGAVGEAVAACGRRSIGIAMVYASGFAEVDVEGRAAQERLQAVARQAGVRLVGPNCMGLSNYADGNPLTFEPLEPRALAKPAVAVIAQSGALASMIRNALWGKRLGVSHVISSGNEADIGCEDFLAFLLDDAATQVVVLFVEQIRRPQVFLALSERARSLRKPIVLMHPGRSERARASALTHTGALTGNHVVMTALLRHHAVVLVDTLDELYDAAELLARFPPPTTGAGVITNSGAVKGFALDFCAEIGFDLPVLAAPTVAALRQALPAFAPAENPVDVTAQVIKEPGIWNKAAAALLADPAIGSLCAPIVPGAGRQAQDKVEALLPIFKDCDKPMVLAAMGDAFALPPEFEAFAAAGVPIIRSPERALRALAHATAYGRALQHAPERGAAPAIKMAPLRGGTIPEYRAKEVLSEIGIAVPVGALARDETQARAIAARVGYPVALKAQAGTLSHKSDVGGIALGIAGEQALVAAWQTMQVNFKQRGLTLDGVLVEAMAPPGVEMIVGARRDPDWGPVVVLGLGGIWTEAFNDIRLIPPDLPEPRIMEELGRLKGAALLLGLRGRPPCDLAAVAQVAARIGALVTARPEISEIDINPLVVYPLGTLALDALIVT
jgi:acyl-CoA synthetase (NDP forming)